MTSNDTAAKPGPVADDLHYPVIVEVTLTHVVWVDGARDPVEAAKMVNDCSYEYLDDQETLAEIAEYVHVPSRWDWEQVYAQWDRAMPYQPMQCDAHVKTHMTRTLRKGEER